MDTERAFARTMADRDHAAFVSFLAADAIFFSGEVALRGRDSVAAGWRRLFEAPDAPFSWEPDQVEVIDSGTLALSSGPVRAPDGRIIGRFNSVWQREPTGEWRVIFDKGSPVCPPPPDEGTGTGPVSSRDPRNAATTVGWRYSHGASGTEPAR